jgi:hypothetical protein
MDVQCEYLKVGGICKISETIKGEKGRKISELKFNRQTGKCYLKMSLKCSAFSPESTI